MDQLLCGVEDQGLDSQRMEGNETKSLPRRQGAASCIVCLPSSRGAGMDGWVSGSLAEAKLFSH